MAKKKATKKKPAKGGKAPTRPGGFKDLKFKLSVLSSLMEEGHFVREAERLKKKFGARTKDYTPVAKVMEYYAKIEIPEHLLATITELLPDGGDLAYVHAMTVWDGEDDTFDISSLEGVQQLVNLERFEPIAMMSSDGVDYTPLLGCAKLTKVDASFASRKSAKAIAELKKRGVEVTE